MCHKTCRSVAQSLFFAYSGWQTPGTGMELEQPIVVCSILPHMTSAFRHVLSPEALLAAGRRQTCE